MTTPRPPIWRDIRVIRVAFQVVVVALVVAFGSWIWGNVQTNTSRSNIPLGFDYLDQPGGITVPGSSLRPTQSALDAVLVGVGNTVRIAIAGIVLATIVGTLIGIARLSENWLLSRLAKAFVEMVRNLPVLVIIVFVYFSVFLRFPRIDDATTIGSVFVLSVKGVGVVWYSTDGKGWAILAVIIAGAVAWTIVSRWRHGVQDRTGQPARAVLWGLGAFVVVSAVGDAVLGFPLGYTTPEIRDRQIMGGMAILPEYAALLMGLVIYTSSHIAEIVRGSIQAVHKGQFEAASALALSNAQRMRLVILPQAMRIAVPALGNQYLNLTKNSSLAVAIGFTELTQVTTVLIGSSAPAVPSYVLMLFLYLGMSLTISACVNVVNRRLALVER